MKTGKLVPRSEENVRCVRFSGSCIDKDLFGSVLTLKIRQNGCLLLQLEYMSGPKELAWTVVLDTEQRKELSEFATSYEPMLTEHFTE